MAVVVVTLVTLGDPEDVQECAQRRWAWQW